MRGWNNLRMAIKLPYLSHFTCTGEPNVALTLYAERQARRLQLPLPSLGCDLTRARSWIYRTRRGRSTNCFIGAGKVNKTLKPSYLDWLVTSEVLCFKHTHRSAMQDFKFSVWWGIFFLMLLMLKLSGVLYFLALMDNPDSFLPNSSESFGDVCMIWQASIDVKRTESICPWAVIRILY